ncbi:MAG: hypothetical protein PHC52_00505 [Syntrophales bacterium]|nr:hypothetical protein [Syntrophales bacterium]
MTTTAIGIEIKTKQTWVKVLGNLRSYEVGKVMREVYDGFEVQGFKISADVRTINIGSQRYVLFGYR